MNGLALEHPERLVWLLALPAVVFVLWWAQRRYSGRLAAFMSLRMQEKLVDGTSVRLGYGLVVFAIGCILVALLGVHFGSREELVSGRGVDIVVALDVSDSMLVRDVESRSELSRLGRAKREIKDLLARLDGDRFGLVVFSGEARIELPLTLDYEAAAQIIDGLDTTILDVKGTAIADAVEVAVQAFEASVAEGRAVILITDGEDTEGDLSAAARKAHASKVHVFGLAVGSDAGAPIPTAGGGWKRKPNGEMVLSRVDEAGLKTLAVATDGDVVRSASGDYDLERIYTQGVKKRVASRELTSRRRLHGADQYRWFIGAAIIALMLQTLLRRERMA